MKDALCFPPTLWTDERVLDLEHAQHRMLLSLCALAARGRPWGRVRPLTGRALTRLLSGASGRQANRSQVERFLSAMEALDLVERTDDGAIWVTLFEDDEDGAGAAAQAGPSQPEGPTKAALRQQRRRERLRREQEEARRVTPGHAQAGVTHEDAGVASHASGGPGTAAGVTPPVSPEGVTPASGSVTPSRPSENVNVGPNVSGVPEKTMFSSDSGDVGNVTPNVGAGHAVTPDVTPGVTPPPFHSCPAKEVPIRRQAWVRTVIGLTGDEGSQRRWFQIWNHLNTAGRLDLADEGVAVFNRAKGADKLPAQAKWGAYLDVTFGNLCRDAGIPIPQGSPEERAEAKGATGALRRSLRDDQEGGIG